MNRSAIPEIKYFEILAGSAIDFVVPVVDEYGKKVDVSSAEVSVGISTNSVSTPYEYLTSTQSGNQITIPVSAAKSAENSDKRRFISVWITTLGSAVPVARICINFVKSTRG